MLDRTLPNFTTSRRVRRSVLVVAAAALSAAPWLLRADSTEKPRNAAKADNPAKADDVVHPAPALVPRPAEPAVDESAMTPADWQAFRAFMSEHSPLKWATFDDMNRRRPQGNTTSQLRRELLGRYSQLRRIEVSDPTRFQFEVLAIRIQDEIYGILGELRKNADADSNERKLREACAALVDVRQQWRIERLRRVRDELADLKLGAAASDVARELEREEGGIPGPGRKTRQELADEMAARFRQNWGKAPALNRALPGGERPGPTSRPATGPT